MNLFENEKTKRDRKTGRNRRTSSFLLLEDSLEKRALMTTGVANVLQLTGTQGLSGGKLQVHYEIEPQGLGITGLNFQVYRSADAVLGPDDKWIGQTSVTSPQELASGAHVIEMDFGQAMRPDPSRPYVVIAGQPQGAVSEIVTADNTASLRKYTVAAISHGGIQGSHRDIPQWEAKIARKLLEYGYDVVIPFNWAGDSRTPGAAARQGPRLGRKMMTEIAELPPGASVDIDYIAHSEGSVVISQAAQWMDKLPAAELNPGYRRMTLLDPHAANPQAPNNAESVSSGMMGWLTKRVISWYKGNARDPLVRVPESITEADVYYQRTPVSINPVNDGLYNLLGQVPVLGTARYISLNSPGIAHSGGGGVYSWFYFNALPFYATGERPTNPSVLEARSLMASDGAWDRSRFGTTDTRPEWSGIAAPNAKVTVYLAAASAKPEDSRPFFSTTADASGQWKLSATRDLRPGSYQVYIRSEVGAGLPRSHSRIMPTVRLGTLKIKRSNGLSASALPGSKLAFGIPKPLNRNGIGLKLSDQPQTFDPRAGLEWKKVVVQQKRLELAQARHGQ